MGSFYYSRGNYDEAFKFFEKSLPFFQENFSKNAGNILNIYQFIGRVLHYKGLYKESLVWFNKTLNLQMRILPPTHPYILQTISYIAGVYIDLGEYTLAIKYLERILDEKFPKLSLNNLDLGVHLNNLGYVLTYNGEYDKASVSLEASLKILKKKLPHHPTYANTLMNMAVLEFLKKIIQK